MSNRVPCCNEILHFFDSRNPGEEYEGIVRSVDGANIDIYLEVEGIEGLVHVRPHATGGYYERVP